MRLTRQPVMRTPAPGYSFVYTPSVPQDLQTGTVARPISTARPTKGVGSYRGVPFVTDYYNGAAAGTSYMSFGACPSATDIFMNSPQGGGTMHVLFKPNSLSSFVIVGKDDNNINSGWVLGFTSAGRLLFELVQQFSNGYLQAADTGVIAVGTWILITLVCGSTNTGPNDAGAHVYVNGVLSDEISSNGSGTSSSDVGDNMTIGGAIYNFGDTIDADMEIGLVAMCRRQQSLAEILEVVRNPWGIFQTTLRPLDPTPLINVVTGWISDTSGANWLSTAGDRASAIDEPTFDDAGFISSPILSSSTTPSIYALTAPLVAGNYTMNLRAKVTAHGRARITFLDAGSSSVGSSAWQALTTSFANYALSATISGTATQLKIEVDNT